MGGNSSKEDKKPNAEPPTQSPRPNLMENTKKVLLIHKSATKNQEKIVGYFKDALEYRPAVQVVYNVNIALKDHKSGLDWLHQHEPDNVVLLILTADTISQVQETNVTKIYEKSGILHRRVFTVSFGQNLTKQSLWPPQGVRYDVENVRHVAFMFEAEDVENLKFRDFDESGAINTLISLINGV